MTQQDFSQTEFIPTVLIVDDDIDMTVMLDNIVSRKCGCVVRTACSGEEALAAINEQQPDVVVTDIKMSGLDGIELLTKIKKQYPSITVIIMTGFGTVDLAVQALKEGAYDFIEKPFDNDHLIHVLQRCLDHLKLIHENRQLVNRLKNKEPFPGLIGKSPRLLEVFELIKKVADTDVTVLIRGESGTGKELAAGALHSLSGRRGKKMVTINCPALPEQILESELFGYAKGAFTGALRDKKGLFLEADGSTILLDEIGDIPLSLQTKLLRVLQEKEIMPLGQTKRIKIDVRVLASTNQDLEQKIRKGAFREDLYYRLNVVTLTMPPLHERLEDIPLLAQHFLDIFCAEYDKAPLLLSQEALQSLIRRPWKGNVRELQNVIKRAVLLTSGEQIMASDLAGYFEGETGQQTAPATPDYPAGVNTELTYMEAKQRLVEKFSRAYLAEVLAQHSGNVTAAARQCGMNRQSLQRLMRQYGLQTGDFRKPQ